MADDSLSLRTQVEKLALVTLLKRAIDEDRYPLSPRIGMLRAFWGSWRAAPKSAPAPLPPWRYYASPQGCCTTVAGTAQWPLTPQSPARPAVMPSHNRGYSAAAPKGRANDCVATLALWCNFGGEAHLWRPRRLPTRVRAINMLAGRG
jgi:hypothetical protein